MQNNKNNNNRFRKLIPTNSRQKNPTTSQIYSSFKPYNASQSKIEKTYLKQSTSNFHSLQRESGEDIKSLRERQILERRLKTISSAAYEGQKQKSQFSDHNLKRRNDKSINNEIQYAKRCKLNNLLELIAEFKIKTDWIFKSEKMEIQNENRMNILGEGDQSCFEEQVYQIVMSTQKSAVKLLVVSMSRVVNIVKSDFLQRFKAYQGNIKKSLKYEEEYQADSYLVSNLESALHENQAKQKKRIKARGNMLDVNKFFQNK